MKKTFYSLLIFLNLLYPKNIFATSFITIEDGRNFRITNAIGGSDTNVLSGIVAKHVSIKTKTLTQYIDDQCALYVGNNTSIDVKKVRIICGSVAYELDDLKPGYYMRDGEDLIFAE